MKNFKEDNRGLSLVELIVTVLITGILMTAVGFFISFSRVTYQDVATSAKLQEEALTVDKVISEALMESESWGIIPSYEVTATKGSLIGTNVDCQILWVVARNNTDNSQDRKCYYFILEKPTGILRYCVDDASTINSTTNTILDETNVTDAVGDKYKLVANNLTSITLLSDPVAGGSKTVFLKCSFEFLGETFTSNISAQSRNIEG